ncbi:MAG: DUF4416 family protein [Desulfatiglandales bacterium]
MSIPTREDDVKLIASIFSPEESLIEAVLADLQDLFGPLDWKSEGLFFDRTRYYEREMGWPLYRRFASFQRLVRPEDLVEIKLTTNEIENRYVLHGKRRVNIDPGYIALERLILATGKNFTHRVYLSRGIYADLTLIFQRGGFRALEWTYRDYSDPDIISCFNDLREKYKRQLRGIEE